MDNRRNLNSETTRTLRKRLGISVKVCSAINRYKRKKGNFKHIDELWRIPGMTKKLFEKVKDKYIVVGQQARESGQTAPYVSEWTSLSKSTGLDSRSFPSLREDWRKFKRKSPKPGPSGVVQETCVIERVQVSPSSPTNAVQGPSDVKEQAVVVLNARKSPSPVREKSSNSTNLQREQTVDSAFPNMVGMKPVQMLQGFTDQRRLLVPITVQQSQSGNKLCIVYSCSPQQAYTGTNTKRVTPPLPPQERHASKTSKPKSPTSPRSKSPSILKRPNERHGESSVSKSQLEESPSSPARDKRVGFRVSDKTKATSTTGSYCSAKEEPIPQTLTETSRVYREKDGITTETITERFRTIGDPSNPRAVGSTVASGEKVSEWINSNSDFMKTPEMPGWGPADLPPRPKMIDGKDVRKLQTVARGRIPRIHGLHGLNKDETLLRHRRKSPGIQTKGAKRRAESPGRRSVSTSPTKSWSEEHAQTEQTKQEVDPFYKPESKSKDPAEKVREDASKGYTFRRKRYRREKSREKTMVMPKRKHGKGQGNSKGKSSQPCIVI